MTNITLTVRSAGDSRTVALDGDRLVIGRAEDGPGHDRGRLLIADAGLATYHSSVNRMGGRVWILDEGSAGGTFVNHQRVPPQGLPLADGDEIFVGGHTTLTVGSPATREQRAPRDSTIRLPLVLAVVAPLLCLAVVVAVRGSFFGAPATNQPAAAPRSSAPPPRPTTDAPPAPTTFPEEARAVVTHVAPGDSKRYLQMSREEQLTFIEQRARNVSTQIGNRPYAFNNEALGYIKSYVDAYARRVGNNSQRLWGEDLRFIFVRAQTQYAPHIIRAFNAQNVPPIVGLYLVMIETEYHNIRGENEAGAAGLFQFIGSTARLYGVEPAERTNVEKMAPAAARYMADRIAEFGPDSMSVALAIAGYNRSPDSVRRDLSDVLNSQNKERSFWTLVANSDKLDHWFRNENVKYVPKFFAAAIVGENPEAFGLDMRKLSTYTTLPSAGAGAAADERHQAGN